MKSKQLGFAHLQMLLIAVLVLGVVGFAAFRVGQNQSNSEQNKNDSSDVDLAGDIKVTEEKQEESKEITIPAEEKLAEAAPVPKASTPVKKTEPTPPKKEKIYVEMQKVLGQQEGSVVKVVSRLASAQSGTCNFKLYQSGYDKVHVSNTINGSTDCVGQLDVTNLATYSGWELHVWFDGSDGKTYGYQKEAAISLTDPN